MKFKVKFRLSTDGGKTQKFAFNLEGEKPLVMGKGLPGLKAPIGTLVVRSGQLFFTAAKAKQPFEVNGKGGSEFKIKEGDVLKSGKISVEFLVVPHVVSPKAEGTQFVDAEELAALNKELTRVHKKSAKFTVEGVEDTPLPEALTEDPEAPEESQDTFETEEEESPPVAEAEVPEAAFEVESEVEPEKPEPRKQEVHHDELAQRPWAAFEGKSTQQEDFDKAYPPIEPAPTEHGHSGRDHCHDRHDRSGSSRSLPRLRSPRSAPVDITSMLSRKPQGNHEKREEIFTFIVIAFVALSLAAGAAKLPIPFVWGLGGVLGIGALSVLLRQFRQFTLVEGSSLDYFRFLSLFSPLLLVWGVANRFSWILGLIFGVAVGFGSFFIFYRRFHGVFWKFAVVGGWVALLPAALTGYMEYTRINSDGEPMADIASAPGQNGNEGQAQAPTQVTTAQAPNPQAPQQQAPQQHAQQPPATTENQPPAQHSAQQTQQPPQQVAQTAQAEQPAAAQKPAAPAKEFVPDPLANEQFFTACKQGNLSVVKSLVSKHAVDPNFTLDKGNTALMYASAYGHLKVVKFLLSQKVNINAQDPNGTTALMWAVYRGHEPVVKFLVSKRADLGIKRDDGDRAIDIARKWKNRSIIAFLESADPNGSRSLASPKESKGKKSKKGSKRSQKRKPAATETYSATE